MPGMNFGFRLPGPFRVGVSSKGRVSVGASLGPFSVSTSSARRSQSKAPQPVLLRGTTLAATVEQAVSEGWRVTGRDDRTVLLARQSDALRLHLVDAFVVEVAPIDSRAKVIGLVLGALLPVALCLVSCEMLGR